MPPKDFTRVVGMQKTFHQSILRRNQLLKRQRKQDLEKFKEEKRDYAQRMLQTKRAVYSSIKAERQARREDWMMGPLAPNRDISKQKGLYGTVSETYLRGPELPKRLQPKEVNIVAGDRVVVVKGRERGRIGQVKDVAAERGECTIEGINTADVAVPQWTPAAKSRNVKHASVELPILLANVRLVLAVRDTPTEPMRDVVIRHSHAGGPDIEHPPGSTLPKHTRYISGEQGPDGGDMEIPWPNAVPEDLQFEEGDTRRLDVEDVSFVPTLYAKDLVDGDFTGIEPESVLEELRGRHVRGRGMFDEETVKKKVEHDIRETWRRSRQALTPQQQYWEQKRKNRESTAAPEVSRETLDLIVEMQGLNMAGKAQAAAA